MGKGVEGDTVQTLLSHLNNDVNNQISKANNFIDISSLTVRTKEKLRTCTTVCGELSAEATELVEPSGVILESEVQELKKLVRKLVCCDNNMMSVGGICIMGSSPPGCPDNLYASLFRDVVHNNHSSNIIQGNEKYRIPLCCLVDSVVGLKPLLHEMSTNKSNGGTTQTRNMLKVNIFELCKLASTTISDATAEESGQVLLGDIKNALNGFYKKFPDARRALDYVAITNGKFPAHFACIDDDSVEYENDLLYEISFPDLLDCIKEVNPNEDTTTNSGTIYPIGSGDSVAAGTLAAWQWSVGQPCAWLNDKVRIGLSSYSQNNEMKKDPTVIGSFVFGLACGYVPSSHLYINIHHMLFTVKLYNSYTHRCFPFLYYHNYRSASCVEEQNSFFDIDKTLKLFENMHHREII